MKNIDKIAELFKIICDNYKGAHDLGKKAAQKMFYFFERAGIKDLNLRYGIHFYGPYSARLDDAMYVLESEGYITIDTSGPTHVIRSCGDAGTETDTLSPGEIDKVEKVLLVMKDKTPLELEALSTMDYIAQTILPTASEEEIKTKFVQVKGTKFDQETVKKTWEELKKIEFLKAP